MLAGQIAYENNDALSAAKFYLEAKKHDPENPIILHRIISSLIATGEVNKAIMHARNIDYSEKASDISRILLFIGHVMEGKYALASKDLDNIEKSLAYKAVTPILYAWLATEQRDIQILLDKISQEAEKGTMSPLYDFHAALINDRLGNKKAALKHYNYSIERNSRIVPRIVIAAGSYYERINETELAQNLYKKLEKSNPNAGILVKIKNLRKKNEKPKPLVVTPKEGISEALYNVAGAMRIQGLSESSLTLVQVALFLNPNFNAAKLLLAQIYQDLNFSSKAIKIYSDIPLDSYEGWNSKLRLAELLTDSKEFNKVIVSESHICICPGIIIWLPVHGSIHGPAEQVTNKYPPESKH